MSVTKIYDNQYLWEFPKLGKKLLERFHTISESGTSEWQLEAVNRKGRGYDLVEIYIELVSARVKDSSTVFQVTISAEDEIFSQKVPVHNTGQRTLFIDYDNVTNHQVKVDIKPLPQNIVCSNLTKDLANLLTSKEFSDVTVVAQDGTEFKAHKAIICARSEVFAVMFRIDMEESKTNRLRIDDMDAEVVEEMLKYMYTGGDIPKKLAEELFIAANKYSLLDLQTLCENILLETMEVETVADILLLADRHTNKRLKTMAIYFMVNNIKTVTETEGWKKLCQRDHDLRSQVLEKTATRRL
ncbi:protein roadkill-like [Musca autumnalis]|uniref:protein roadkill-like n=1 Tax=Musca autumnalis TaxID=221902 RepID=UPI003CF64E22